VRLRLWLCYIYFLKNKKYYYFNIFLNKKKIKYFKTNTKNTFLFIYFTGFIGKKLNETSPILVTLNTTEAWPWEPVPPHNTWCPNPTLLKNILDDQTAMPMWPYFTSQYHQRCWSMIVDPTGNDESFLPRVHSGPWVRSGKCWSHGAHSALGFGRVIGIQTIFNLKNLKPLLNLCH